VGRKNEPMPLSRGVLIRWANKDFKILPLLEQVGLEDPYVGQLCFCPFHDDEAGGRRSGKIFKDCLHCFSEAKQYRPYDVLVFLGYTDVDIERTLRSRGDVPDEILHGYADIERIDLRGNLLFERSKFIAQRVDFLSYANMVCLSFMNTLLNRKV
jgi:hypothetical protein